mgnify:CR=1 FL=1
MWDRWTVTSGYNFVDMHVHVFYWLLLTLGFSNCLLIHTVSQSSPKFGSGNALWISPQLVMYNSYLSWIVFWGFCRLTKEQRLLECLAFRRKQPSLTLYTSLTEFIANDTVKCKFCYYDLSLGLSIIVNRTK